MEDKKEIKFINNYSIFNYNKFCLLLNHKIININLTPHVFYNYKKCLCTKTLFEIIFIVLTSIYCIMYHVHAMDYK